jgi:putative pyrroloquinoline-quinone binding quinoprotein/IPT/TIG domain-containing protein
VKRLAAILAGGLVLAAPGNAQPPTPGSATAPTITSLSSNAVPRSGRLLVTGSGFGSSQGMSTLRIGGSPAAVTRWSDTQIVGYAPENALLGTLRVQVVVGGASSNVVPLAVMARQTSGRVRWRFQVDAQVGYLLQRPAVGPDGTVVIHDPVGHVYALTPAGGLKWIFTTAGGAAGPPSIGPDGTVYVAASSTIYALTPKGSLRWTFTDPASQGVIVGPTVGPDGNVYAVTDIPGLGALALSPTGQLLWSNHGNPVFYEMGQIGAEMAFGSGRTYAGDDHGTSTGGVLHALTLGGSEVWANPAGGTDNGGMQGQRQPAIGPDGTVYLTAWQTFRDPCNGSCLYAFDPSGLVRWTYSPWPSNGMSEPSVGADGTIYVGRSLSYLDAVRPDGTARWSVLDGGILAHPTVDPRNTQVLGGEAPNYGEPGNVRDFSASDGHLRWQLPLPSENGGYQVLYSRPRFAADGQTAYFGTFISAPDSSDQYAYLYAVDTSHTTSALPPGLSAWSARTQPKP